MVFADAEEGEPDLVGEHRFFDHVAQHLGLRQQTAVGTDGHVSECIQPELNRLRHVPPDVAVLILCLQTPG